MRSVKILSVCGSGTVSSAMLTSKLKDLLESEGYRLDATEISPGGVELAMSSGSYDMIVYTSPVHGDYNVPVINATGYLVGLNEEAFIEEFLEHVKKLSL